MAAPWAHFDVELALKLYADGLSAGEVSRQLGVGKDAVLNQLHKAGVETTMLRPKRRDVDTAEVLRLRDAGSTWKQIGVALGCSASCARERFYAAHGMKRVGGQPFRPPRARHLSAADRTVPEHDDVLSERRPPRHA